MCGRAFKPTGTPMPKLRKIDLLRDELETLKLCDMEGMTQEEAGKRMGISRGTVQRILTTARKKTAEALVTGAALVFQGDFPEIKPFHPKAPDLDATEDS
ncbi:MAG: DNA-binding protein [Desulfobulbaceae bacterium DB1]|nr:MAG: DNA-binding protein [Desulfobulbaceae bacterium DB1]